MARPARPSAKPKGVPTPGDSKSGFFRPAYWEWLDRWQGVSRAPRIAYLDALGRLYKSPTAYYGRLTNEPQGVSPEKFPGATLAELIAAGLVETVPDSNPKKPTKVVGTQAAEPFASALEALSKERLTDADRTTPLTHKTLLREILAAPPRSEAYLAVARRIDKTLREVRTVPPAFVTSAQWAESALAYLDDPVLARVYEALADLEDESDEAEFARRFAAEQKVEPAQVREAIDVLVGHSVLFEGLNPASKSVQVGLLKEARESYQRTKSGRTRPPLEVCERPAVFGPEGGVFVDDLRAFLLEIASDPPRLKADGSLFARELPRFLDAFEEVPEAFRPFLISDQPNRYEFVETRAAGLNMVGLQEAGREERLGLSRAGTKWLASDLAEQYETVYKAYSAKPGNSHDPLDAVMAMPGPGNGHGDQWYDASDANFLGSHAFVVPKERGGFAVYTRPKEADFAGVRQALLGVFGGLQVGVFHPLEGLLRHFAWGEVSFLLGTRSPEASVLRLGHYLIPPLREEQEAFGQFVLRAFIATRLIPLGCLRVALDADNRACVAKTGRLEAYFGVGKIPRTGGAGKAAAAETRVIIQPDFSVIVYGLNPAPLGELAPFCERVTKGGVVGAHSLKITRDSVIKAVGRGMKGADMLERLTRLSSIALPPNVIKEVRGWADWVRRVKLESLPVLRCPDASTADRVVDALKGKAERITPLIVGLTTKDLTKAQRDKLAQGGLLMDEPRRGAASSKRRTGRDDW